MKDKILWFLVFFFTFFIFLIPYICKAEGLIDSMGVDWQYGIGTNSHSTNVVNRFSVWAENRTILPDPWALQAEIHRSDHKLNERPDHGQDTGFKEFGFNVSLKRYFFNDAFHVGVLGGFSYVPGFPFSENRKHWQINGQIGNIGRSHCLGTFGALVGFGVSIYGHWSLKTEVRYTHTSDPFTKIDTGLNYLSGSLGVVYKF